MNTASRPPAPTTLPLLAWPRHVTSLVAAPSAPARHDHSDVRDVSAILIDNRDVRDDSSASIVRSDVCDDSETLIVARDGDDAHDGDWTLPRWRDGDDSDDGSAPSLDLGDGDDSDDGSATSLAPGDSGDGSTTSLAPGDSDDGSETSLASGDSDDGSETSLDPGDSGDSSETSLDPGDGHHRLAALTLALALLLLTAAPAHGQPTGASLVWLPLALRDNANPVHTGVATYYHATGNGACLFGDSPGDLLVAALNAEEYDNAFWCGAYVRVTGPHGSVTVRIVDLCPECRAGHLDLSQQAFAAIAPLPLGRVPITWQVISPPLSGPIAYHFKDGSNQWWTAVQIRNSRNPIASLEYWTGSAWVNVPRTGYNYFVQTEPGMGPGPYTFRVTDHYGHPLTDSGLPHVEDGTVNGSAQFPPGP